MASIKDLRVCGSCGNTYSFSIGGKLINNCPSCGNANSVKLE